MGFARLRLAASWADFSGVHLCRADEQVSEVSVCVEVEVEVVMARRENRDRLRFGSGAVYDSTLTFWAAMVVMPIAASALMSSFICGDNLLASVAVKLRASALRVAFAFRAAAVGSFICSPRV